MLRRGEQQQEEEEELQDYDEVLKREEMRENRIRKRTYGVIFRH